MLSGDSISLVRVFALHSKLFWQTILLKMWLARNCRSIFATENKMDAEIGISNASAPWYITSQYFVYNSFSKPRQDERLKFSSELNFTAKWTKRQKMVQSNRWFVGHIHCSDKLVRTRAVAHNSLSELSYADREYANIERDVWYRAAFNRSNTLVTCKPGTSFIIIIISACRNLLLDIGLYTMLWRQVLLRLHPPTIRVACLQCIVQHWCPCCI